MWLGDSREYSRNYRVYAVDIPGEPGKSDETQLPFSGPAFVDIRNSPVDIRNPPVDIRNGCEFASLIYKFLVICFDFLPLIEKKLPLRYQKHFICRDKNTQRYGFYF